MEELLIDSATVESNEFQDFMEANKAEIETIFPHYSEDDAYYSSVYLLRAKTEIIGVFVYQMKGDELHVDVDYLIESYRDRGLGREFFIRQLEEFKGQGFKLVVALTNNDEHKKYLVSCGFVNSTKHEDRFELDLNFV